MGDPLYAVRNETIAGVEAPSLGHTGSGFAYTLPPVIDAGATYSGSSDYLSATTSGTAYAIVDSVNDYISESDETNNVSAGFAWAGGGPVAEGSVSTPVNLAASTDLPYAGTVDNRTSYYEITGLTAGTAYTVSASRMSADVNLHAFMFDPAFNPYNCESSNAGTLDENCSVIAQGTSMWIWISGSYTKGASFTLDAVEIP